MELSSLAQALKLPSTQTFGDQETAMMPTSSKFGSSASFDFLYFTYQIEFWNIFVPTQFQNPNVGPEIVHLFFYIVVEYMLMNLQRSILW